jgi:4-amino-4-deoxy-L-arabinose transferase-like glycosyltransferase
MSTIASETRVARRSPSRVLAMPAEQARRRPRAAVLLILGFAAVVYLSSLGRSSFFIDEIFSWNASNHGLDGVSAAVHKQEVTPPLYYVLMHLWISVTGAESEFALRLPSALAGVAFVGASMWLGSVVVGPRVALVTGLLTALSPLTLLYAQEVRAYIFVMLAVTVAAAAAIKFTQEPERRRWLVLAVAASTVSVLLHYTAVLVLGPLSLWMLTQTQLPLRSRLAVGAAVAVPFLLLVPLLLGQLSEGHQSGGNNAYAKITPIGLLKLAATPWDGRALSGMSISYELGFLALVDAVALIAFADAFRRLKTRWLLVGAAMLPVLAIVAVSALFTPMALTRYTAVAAPFMLVAVAVAIVRMPKAIGISLLSVALAAGVIGIGAANTSRGQWPDVRGAMQDVSAKWQKGDAVVGLANLAFNDAMSYYQRELPAAAPMPKGYFSTYDAMRAPEVRKALDNCKNVYVVSSPPVNPADLYPQAGENGGQVLTEQQWGGAYPVQVNRVAAPC